MNAQPRGVRDAGPLLCLTVLLLASAPLDAESQARASGTVDAATVARLRAALPAGGTLLRVAPQTAPDSITRAGTLQLFDNEVLLAMTGTRTDRLERPERFGFQVDSVSVAGGTGGASGAGGASGTGGAEAPGAVAPPQDSADPAPATAEDPTLLPWQWVALDAEGLEAVTFRPVFAVAEPLRYNSEEGHFRARLLLGLVDESRPGVSRSLATAVGVRVLAGDADGVDPEVVRMDRTNELLVSVSVLARSPVDSLRLEFRPNALTTGGVEAWVPVRPSLVVEARPRSIQGFGLEAAEVDVRLLGRSPAQRPQIVRVSGALGRVEAQDVEIGPAGSGGTRLRSRSLGWDTVTASGVGLATVAFPLRYVFPWLFLGASMLGGMAGAGLRMARAGEPFTPGAPTPPSGTPEPAPPPHHPRPSGWKRTLTALAMGSLLGVVVAVSAFVLGLDLVGLDPSAIPFTEGAAFGLAALAAWFGVRPTLVRG